jgi:hypothetical protein
MLLRCEGTKLESLGEGGELWFFTDVACMHPMFSAQLTGKSVARTLIGQDCECGLEIIFAQVDYISLLSLFVTENLQNYNTIIHLNAQFCSRQIVPRGLPMQTSL